MAQQSGFVRRRPVALALSALALALASGTLQPAFAAEAKTKLKAKTQIQKVLPKAALGSTTPQDGTANTLARPGGRPGNAGLPAVQKPGLSKGQGALNDPRLEQLRELNAARDLKDLKDAIPAVPGAPRQSDNLADIPGSPLGQRRKGGFGRHDRPGQDDGAAYESPFGEITSKLPDNNRGRGRSPLVPSMSPSDWSRGLAGQDSGGGSSGSEGETPRTEGEITRDDSGEVREVAEVRTHRDGRTSYFRATYHQDGSVSYEGQDRDGNFYKEHHPSGRPVPSRSVDDVDRGTLGGGPRPREGLARTQDPDADDGRGMALLCHDMPWHRECQGESIDFNGGKRVNPGPEDVAAGGFVPGPSLDLSEEIVVNPNPVDPPAAGDPEAAARSLEQSLKRRHSEPDDPRGER